MLADLVPEEPAAVDVVAQGATASGEPGEVSVLQRGSDTLIIAAATAFVVWHLHPELLITPTITTGGDTASHYYAAWWLRHALLPVGRLSGWVPGSFAGFPLFQLYFPLPFVLMAALSLIVGLPVAFKLITVAGLVLLPAAAYACFRLLGLAHPAPALAAVFSVSFLFHEANSMWGANVGSTLAGEFTYSFATTLLLLLAGTLYRGAISDRGWIGNGVLLAAVGLSHAYALLVAAALGAYLVLFHPAGRRALPYLVKVGALAFGLMAFWALPLVAYSDYTTAYSIVWPIQGFSHVFPPILWPSLAILTAGGVAAGVRLLVGGRRGGRRGQIDHRVAYLASLIPGSLFFYLVAWKLDVVDVRFLPFVQLTLVLLAAVPAAAMIRSLAQRSGQWQRPGASVAVLTLLLAVAALVWTGSSVEAVDDWAAWNYGGFEATPGWQGFRSVNEEVRRTSAEPRVAYEHSTAHNDAGTIRAFESLPLFSGASTLEGLYMQSSISSPFVFYIQSEISEVPSCPLLPYHCGHLEPARAAEHLRLYNVTEVIARGDEVKARLAASSEFTRVNEVPPYEVFRVMEADGAYVVPLRYEPLVLVSDDWKADFFAWFKRPGSGDVPLLRATGEAEVPVAWERITDLPDRIPRRPLSASTQVTSEVLPEEIRIRTSRPGHPLLVKITYHPRWSVQGADAVWLASPSFMLVVPTEEEVRLFYSVTGVERFGRGLTLLALVVVALGGFRRWRKSRGKADPKGAGGSHGTPPETRSTVESTGSTALDRVFTYRWLWGPTLAIILVMVAVAVRMAWTDPWIPHRQGLELFHSGSYEAAEPLFSRSKALAPSSAAAYYSDYYLCLSAFREMQWEEALSRLDRFIRDYPDGELIPEAHFRTAEALQGLGRIDDAAARFLQILDEFPTTQWAGFAADRLAAIAADRAAPAMRESGATGSRTMVPEASMAHHDRP